ncbi:arylalcohol dehydrogenase [Coniophora puteana RWD-64-598 SS2]|uniref:Arylalcohol dehydrogenase n=1 Tax=Coniophora puteana (strain RWD-64-598) TaxID=741705 RepID=A0A5M3MXM1_CONPW|nr:arylalcohol dehydrogenase [Coniophora puteana RWD-64-598 SS2]EIW83747.1 arylalcohol dehydrogenase [Coniophora puteana RWD-64-598 SS2]
MSFSPVLRPASRLARYRALAPKASVHVSPIQLGAMSIGDKWEQFGMGSMNKESSFKLLDAYYDAGGNFIDTANNYQDQSSEQFIGEWVEKRGNRDQLVIATKYTLNPMIRHDNVRQKVAFGGNSLKSLHNSVNNSLKNLRTDYLDILYVHYWDHETSIEEVMDGLHALVLQGKVLYLGISDTPAWIVSQANQYARDHGKSQFVIYQGAWSVLDRSFEREIIPMARAQGMALAPYRVLATGRLRSNEEEEQRRKTGEHGRTAFGLKWERSSTEKLMVAALEEVAKDVGAEHHTSVAIAYVMQKAPYVFPILGGRKVEHLEANLEALSIKLKPEHFKKLESAVPFDLGFPYATFGNYDERSLAIARLSAYIEYHPRAQPMGPEED